VEQEAAQRRIEMRLRDLIGDDSTDEILDTRRTSAEQTTHGSGGRGGGSRGGGNSKMPKREKQRVQGQEGATQLDDISAFVAELFKSGGNRGDGATQQLAGGLRHVGRSTPKVDMIRNPAWIGFASPEYEQDRRRCLGAARPWNPYIPVPESLVPSDGQASWGGVATGRRRLGALAGARAAGRRGRRLRFARVTTSLLSMCRRVERRISQTQLGGVNATMTPSQRMLQACLLSDSGCYTANRSMVEAELSRMAGIQALRRPPGCSLITRDRECGRIQPNKETGSPRAFLPEGETDLRPTLRARADLQQAGFATCALVSNGPLIKIAKNGRAVDAHSSVWRFNLMAGGGNQEEWAGSKTTMRMLNRLRGIEAAGLRAESGRKPNLKVSPGEQWLFWSAASAAYLKNVKARHPRVHVSLLHADMIAWILEVYFQLREDLAMLGISGFSCPVNLSSGIHAVLMATKACQRTNLFGFSYSQMVLRSRPGHMNKGHTMHKAHAWEFDVLVIRLLHLAGHAHICTGDDPSLDIKDLRAGTTPVK